MNNKYLKADFYSDKSMFIDIDGKLSNN